MQRSYTKNYLKIYFFQILSIALGFVSMFIVVPYLSSDQTTYGIYSVCISVTIFLAYADLGFLGAGQKYAAESYARGDTRKELELVGFSHFILLVVVLLMSGIFLYLSFHPDKLINGLEDPQQVIIARRLLLILACFAPTVVIQRMLQMIFGIRLQEYNLQKINILGSVIKIVSVFYFFGGGRYDIVGYYLFIQIISAGVALGGIWMAKRNYNYDFGMLVRRFRFSKEVFRHTRSLASSSLFATLSWVLYYELDSVAIGKMIGAQAVAIYAIGLTLLGFLRSLLGVFFSPFSARFNHFVGVGQMQELRVFYQHVVTVTFPLVVFPLLSIAIMARGIVISWVGVEYEPSVAVAQWLVLCNILAFISYPTGMLLIAQENMRKMYIVNSMMPVIFWTGIFTTLGFWGVESFAIFKFTALIVSGICYLWYTLQFLEISLWQFLLKTILPYWPALTAMIIVLVLLRNSCIDEKSKLNLLYNGLIVGGSIITALTISLITVKPLRQYVVRLLRPASNNNP